MVEQRTSLNDSFKQFQTEYQKLEANNLEMDLKYANKQVNSVLDIKRENKKLKTQLLMLSDLYQGLTAKFNACKTNASQQELDSLINEPRVKELKGIVGCIMAILY
jgi:Skp family chaperone for outer membrane proteins